MVAPPAMFEISWVEAMTQSQIEEAKIQEQSDTRARIRSGLAETAGYMM